VNDAQALVRLFNDRRRVTGEILSLNQQLQTNKQASDVVSRPVTGVHEDGRGRIMTGARHKSALINRRSSISVICWHLRRRCIIDDRSPAARPLWQIDSSERTPPVTTMSWQLTCHQTAWLTSLANLISAAYAQRRHKSSLEACLRQRARYD